MKNKPALLIYVGLVVVAAIVAVDGGLAFGVPNAPPLVVLSFSSLALVLELGGVNLAHKAKGSVAFIIQLAVAILYGPTWAAATTGTTILISELASRKEL